MQIAVTGIFTVPRDGNLNADTLNFRVDPDLKAAFARAAEAEHRPAAQVLRDFMRVYVRRRERKQFEASARQQSLEAAAAARDPLSDDAVSLQEWEALFDEDLFPDER